jgi:predicted RNase H-like nuclease (RuvC/YqgF family)
MNYYTRSELEKMPVYGIITKVLDLQDILKENGNTIYNLRQENEKLKQAIKEAKDKESVLNNKIDELTNEYAKSCIKLADKSLQSHVDCLYKLKDDAFKKYCENDIQMTKKLAFFAKDYNMWMRTPSPISKYEQTAKHIRNKYEALIKAGFSHDDAMSLIPMWMDDCEVDDAD